MKTYRFKLYKSERNEKLHRQINAAGLIYNHCIALHKRYYKIFGEYLNKNQLQKHLVKLKKMPKFSYIKVIGSQAVPRHNRQNRQGFSVIFLKFETKGQVFATKF